MVIFICTRNTELNTYEAGGGRGECIGTRLSLRSAPMTGGRTAQARIFRSTDAEAHETGTHPTENKKNHSRRWRAAGSSSAPAAAAQVVSSCPPSASNTGGRKLQQLAASSSLPRSAFAFTPRLRAKIGAQTALWRGVDGQPHSAPWRPGSPLHPPSAVRDVLPGTNQPSSRELERQGVKLMNQRRHPGARCSR
jgi:hypothetical protein